MNTVVIIIENDVFKQGIHNGLYLGRSGDFAIINHFVEIGWNVILTTPSFLSENKFFGIKEIQYSTHNVHIKAIFQEYQNIINNLPPSFGAKDGLLGKVVVTPIKITEISLLISRVMPQSLTNEFLSSFENLATISKNTPQNMQNICLYKDKVIPYLLQNNAKNIEAIYKNYSPQVSQFQKQLSKNYSTIAINTSIVRLENATNIEEELQKIPLPICVKPLNLFGGIGVGVFENYKNSLAQFAKINREFEKYQITEKLVLIQEAVQNPEFGDIRVMFSKGKFLGAFKRYEPINKIHNTINGARIIPVCDEALNFSDTFPKNLHTPFTQTISVLKELFLDSDFLKKEFICGCDLLLDGNSFKLTETNIACPTGFSFLEASLIYIKHGKELTISNFNQYFEANPTLISRAISPLILQSL
jgi:hypothetical protein